MRHSIARWLPSSAPPGHFPTTRRSESNLRRTRMSTLVEIRNVSKIYERGKQKVEVLHHIDLDIANGDFFALMGPSGSGKTTLLNLIGGPDSPPAGRVAGRGGRVDKLRGSRPAEGGAAARSARGPLSYL